MSSHDVWYLTRASGLTAYGLLWISVVWGLFSSLRLARNWPGAATAVDVHEHVSLLALGFSTLHVAILLADATFGLSPFELLVPFAPRRSARALGLGQIAFALLAVVTLSHYARKRIGQRAWRALHRASFAVYALVLGHALLAGTDSASRTVFLLYVASASLVVLLTTYRVLSAFERQSRSYSSNTTPAAADRRSTNRNPLGSK